MVSIQNDDLEILWLIIFSLGQILLKNIQTIKIITAVHATMRCRTFINGGGGQRAKRLNVPYSLVRKIFLC